MSQPKVVLADDHQLVAAGLKTLLSSRFEVVATVVDGLALIAAVQRFDPEVVVADIAMPGLNGIEATARLRREAPRCRIVILTMHREPAYARRALAAGASGYVLKVAAPTELIRAIDAVLSGMTYVTPEIADALEPQVARGQMRHGDAVLSLTPRQREVLQLLAAGKTAKEIGALLGISARTVESHKYELMRVAGLTRAAELIRLAVRLGLAEDG